jgi:hypothetical protein
MCPEERAYLAHRQRNPLLGLLPREHAYFRIRREHRGLHGDGVGMGGDIIRQDQHGRLAITDEIARHSKNEVGIVAVHLGQQRPLPVWCVCSNPSVERAHLPGQAVNRRHDRILRLIK